KKKKKNYLANRKTLLLEQDLQDTNSKLNNVKKDNATLKNEKGHVLREKDRVAFCFCFFFECANLAQDIQDLKYATDLRMKALEEENKALANENAQLKSGLGDSEGTLQKKYAAQLAEALEEQEENHNLFKKKMEDMYQTKLDNLENGLAKQIKDLTITVDDQTKRITDLEKDLQKTEQEKEQALKDLEREVFFFFAANPYAKFREFFFVFREQIKYSNKHNITKRKAKILDEKTTVEKGNIDLRNEIEKLKEKLDMFEEKYHIRSPVPSKKRRRTDSTLMVCVVKKKKEGMYIHMDVAGEVEAKVLKSVKGPIIDSNLIFPLECITRQYEGDWIGFELQNQWNKPIILKGWSLTDTEQTSRLSLPEKRLNPKDIIRVCLTDNAKEQTDLLWKGLKLKKGDKHELWVEDELNFRHKLAIIPIPANTPGFVS
ncbi:viral A-type inclusion protein, partial [Reticulomyxa filosa]